MVIHHISRNFETQITLITDNQISAAISAFIRVHLWFQTRTNPQGWLPPCRPDGAPIPHTPTQLAHTRAAVGYLV